MNTNGTTNGHRPHVGQAGLVESTSHELYILLREWVKAQGRSASAYSQQVVCTLIRRRYIRPAWWQNLSIPFPNQGGRLLLTSLILLHFRYSPSNGLDVAVGQSSSNYILGYRRVELW